MTSTFLCLLSTDSVRSLQGSKPSSIFWQSYQFLKRRRPSVYVCGTSLKTVWALTEGWVWGF